MLRANALFVVVVIALVIGILCSSLIVIAYFQRLQIQKDLLIKRLDLNASSAINILLSNSDQLTYGEEKFLDLYGDEIDSVNIKKFSWGIFEIGAVKAFSGNTQNYKSILYGYKPDDKLGAAIYLTDQNSQLALCGSTVVNGKCYLPESGVKRAYIEGQAFGGKNLINGEIKKSENVLPALNKAITDRIFAFFTNKGNSEANIQVYAGEPKDTLIRSFSEKTLVIYNAGPLSLKNKKYQGNIIVCSDNLIDIDSSSKLNDILIFSSGVKVSDHFKGALQIFCTDSLVLGSYCDLGYPSVLGLIKKDFNVPQPYIQIGSNSKLKGIVFASWEVEDLQQVLIKIEKDAEVEGQVYSDGFIELKGNVLGNVTCNKFTLKTPSSVYENHLLNVIIDNEKLSPFFVGSSLITSSKQKKIVKWLE